MIDLSKPLFTFPRRSEKLIQLATSIINSKKLGDNTAGDVGCALLTQKGKVYLGVSIDTISGMGYCAKQNAIGSMVTGGL